MGTALALRPARMAGGLTPGSGRNGPWKRWASCPMRWTGRGCWGRLGPRLEGRSKVTGATRFTADLHPHGLCHARLVLSTVPAGRVSSVETSDAINLPGVLGVLTWRDFAGADDGLLARDRVTYVGHPVAVVVAETVQAATDGAEAVLVEFEATPYVLDPLEALADTAPDVLALAAPLSNEALGAHSQSGGGVETEMPSERNVTNEVRFTSGDVEQELARCSHVVSARYRMPCVHHCYIEPHVSTAQWEPDETMTVWTPTQSMFFTREVVARALGFPISRVRIVPMPVGGGFGGKDHLIEPLVALLARHLRRPVRLGIDPPRGVPDGPGRSGMCRRPRVSGQMTTATYVPFGPTLSSTAAPDPAASDRSSPTSSPARTGSLISTCGAATSPRTRRRRRPTGRPARRRPTFRLRARSRSWRGGWGGTRSSFEFRTRRRTATSDRTAVPGRKSA